MSDLNITNVLKSMVAQPPAPVCTNKMHPMIRKIILEQFLKVRQQTAERVDETVVHPNIIVKTFTTFDADGNMTCEDIVVESRK